MKLRWLAALAGSLALAALSEAAPGAVLLRALGTLALLAAAQSLALRLVPSASKAVVALWAASPVALPFVYLLARIKHVDAWTPVGVMGGLLVAGFLLTVRAARNQAAWAQDAEWPKARWPLPEPSRQDPLPLWLAGGALALILALAFWLRWPLLHEGLPYSWIWDELWTAHEAVRMWRAGAVIPQVTYYPALAVYLQLGWVKLWGPLLVGGGPVYSGLQDQAYLWVMQPSVLLLLARLFNTLLACVALLALYRAAALSYGRIGALCAAAWLAVDPFFLRYSTWTIVDFTTAAFAVLWLLALALHLNRPSRWTAARLAMAAGLVIASKYNAAVLLLVSFAVIVPWRQGWRAWARALGTGTAWALLAFCVASPTLILDLRGVGAGLQYNVDMYGKGGHPGFLRIDNHALKAWHDLSSVAARSGMAGLLCLLPLIGWGAWHWKSRAVSAALAAAGLYLLLMSRTVVCNDANLLLLAPLFIFAAGLGLAWLARWGGLWLALFLTAAALWLPLTQDLQARQDALLHGSDARHLVALQAAAFTHGAPVAVLRQAHIHPEDLALLGGPVVFFDAGSAQASDLRQAGCQFALLSDVAQAPDLGRRFGKNQALVVQGQGDPVDEGKPSQNPPTWLIDLSKVR